MKNWNSVEEKWREQLQNKSDDIPEGLWSRIEERLDEKPARRFPIYWAAAAMLLIAIGISWNYNPATEEDIQATKVEKSSAPVEMAVTEPSPLVLEVENSSLPTLKSSPAEVAMATSTTPEVTIIEQAPTEIVVASAPSIEKKSDAEEVIIVRLDIDPIEEVKPTFTKQKRRKSLFGKIVGEIRQALDGEPVNWQKLKEGNPALENNIHNVANTYIKTEENLKRTLQIQ
ncbi:hypothetical protein ACST14_05220 [Aquirufa sp. A-Brett2-15D]